MVIYCYHKSMDIEWLLLSQFAASSLILPLYYAAHSQCTVASCNPWQLKCRKFEVLYVTLALIYIG